MSFILDAIAKSERERQQQEIPDARILAMPVANTRRSRRILPYILVGALLLNIFVLLIWVQSNESPFNWFSQTENSSLEHSMVNQRASLDKSENINSSIANAPVHQLDEINSAISPALSAQSSITENIPQTIKPLVDDAPLAETKGNNATVNKNTQVDVNAKSDAPVVQYITENRGGNSDMSFAVEKPAQPQLVGNRDSASQTGIQNVMEPMQRKVFRLGELPADVRRDLPSVSFSGHLFSKNVNVSYVMVDGGRSVIAGQEIVEDVFLHQVTPNGAIVDFRGHLIEIGILQNWSLK